MPYAQDRIQKSGGAYADAGSYGCGAYAGVGVGHARAEFCVFEAEANGPSMSVGAQASHGVSAMAGAEVASVSVGAGPLKVKAGLGFNTGGSVGPDGVEVLFLGTGIRLGSNPKVSMMGSSAECSVM